MALSHLTLKSITPADIGALITNGAAESRELDFKRDFSLTKDAEKKEFACDVASLANTIGGDLVYGIEEKDGRAAALTGVTLQSEDVERQRIESSLAHAIAPRLAGLEVRLIDVSGGKQVLIVRVPQSPSAPHMVVYNNDSRFYGRNASQRFVMDVLQVRESFMATEQIANRLRAFRSQRLDWIRTSEVGVRLGSPHLIVLHLLPVASLRGAQRFPLRTLKEAGSDDLQPIYVENGWTPYINLDGVRVAEHDGDRRESGYVHVFRSGAMEAVDTVMLHEVNQKKLFASYEMRVRQGVYRYLGYLKKLGMTGECAIGLSLLDVKGYRLARGDENLRMRVPHIDRDALVLPEATVEIDVGKEAVDGALRGLFDLVWNVGGISQSPNFDPQSGKWLGDD